MNRKGQEEPFVGVGSIYLECGDGFKGAYVSQTWSNQTSEMYFTVFQLYLNKVVQKLMTAKYESEIQK
jgi:hypothetical protein